ncbi:membrane protein insertase YidC [Azorhizobium oxalatiphilum]|uniref:Membrane protein insertase YidC n=1 Tax=Azorhizobium oxalatiphilum TaxID=980631 RepID=A0A917FGZ3_9HYPH|nr:membrane protein insertase YidC [Azorhizobium oxalatiphilum]GGF79113.1 membrane protein insertase YidC [Azorhizobium oxalatiphilum]
MTDNNRNMFIAIGLSLAILLGWQYFIAMPQEKQRQAQLQQQQATQAGQTQTAPGSNAGSTPQQPGAAPSAPGAGGAPTRTVTRAQALEASPRVAIETPALKGSIALRGGRADDLLLAKYRETIDPKSPNIVLLSPSGAPAPFYAEFGWTSAPGAKVALPGADTLWTAPEGAKLTPSTPLTLSWDNGQGQIFRRTFTVDDHYMFTVKDEVENKGGEAITLYPYALVSRHGMPHTEGFYILHEGLVGVMGDHGLQEVTYSKMDDAKPVTHKATGGWLGITDKYWAATVIPDQKVEVDARFSSSMLGQTRTFQADFLAAAKTVEPGATATTQSRLFAGAKEVAVVDGYETQYQIDRFDRLIDWGWFYFITKPLFLVIDWIYKLVGNFGIAILAVTVLLKAIFFPLANKSYASMAKMKALQPEMVAIRERYADDKVKQQQATMELYKKEKINPVAGCLPIIIQIPVFFALYKVLFVTIEMRQAPFFGWIHDLSAPDPTTVFNLFGLIPWDPSIVPVLGPYLMLGAWPLIMGVTMWVQMKLNPAPPDPTQQMIFNYMPIIFTFMLAHFAAGLVIYWAWNNTLSVIQQAAIMKRHGVKIELWDNIRSAFRKKAPAKG